MTAFKNLPPWNDFVKGRDSDMLRMRSEFNERLWQMHQRTLAKHSTMKTAGQEQDAYERWSERRAQCAKRRKREEPRLPCLACASWT